MDTMPEDLSERDERLGAIVFACLQAIEQGRALDHREVLARHPEFTAELTEFFIDRAELQQWAAPLREVAQAAWPRMRIVCPHCCNPIELVDLPADDGELVCPSCGSTCRLEGESTAPWSPREDQRRLGRFELIETVGVGPFGTVYRARDSQLDRVVAIKVPRAGSLA